MIACVDCRTCQRRVLIYCALNHNLNAHEEDMSEHKEEQQSESTPLLAKQQFSLEEGSLSSSVHSSRQIRRAVSLLAAPITHDTGGALEVFMGTLGMLICGTILGLILPKNEDLPTARFLSASFGYTYFFAWSVSFYPQCLMNYRRKTTQGLSADYVGLDLLGYASYSIYTLGLFYSPAIQKLYHERYGENAESTVQPNDILFAVHAIFITSLTLGQIAHYDGLSALLPSKVIGKSMIGILAACFVYSLMILANIGQTNWLDYLYMLSAIKIIVTLMKYVPQILLNHRRKSTEGWSVWQVLLDILGAALSDLQLVVDSIAFRDFSGITGNLAKLSLGLVSIVCDVIFMLQHYVWYPQADMEDEPPFWDESSPQIAADALTNMII